MNKVFFIGRIASDIKNNKVGDTAHSSFSFAVDRKYKNKDGSKTTDFFQIVAWRKTAELINRYTSKGSKLMLECNCQTRNYENKDGNKVYITEFVVDEFEFLDSKKQAPKLDNSTHVAETQEDFTPIDDDTDLLF